MSVGSIGGSQPPNYPQDSGVPQWKKEIEDAKADLKKNPPNIREAYQLLIDALAELNKLGGNSSPQRRQDIVQYENDVVQAMRVLQPEVFSPDANQQQAAASALNILNSIGD